MKFLRRRNKKIKTPLRLVRSGLEMGRVVIKEMKA